MKLSKKQIIWLVVLVAIAALAIAFLREEVVEMADVEKPASVVVNE